MASKGKATRSEIVPKWHVLSRIDERARCAEALPQIGDVRCALARGAAARRKQGREELVRYGCQSPFEDISSQASGEFVITGFELTRRDLEQMLFDERARLPWGLLRDVVPIILKGQRRTVVDQRNAPGLDHEIRILLGAIRILNERIEPNDRGCQLGPDVPCIGRFEIAIALEQLESQVQASAARQQIEQLLVWIQALDANFELD